MILKDILNKLGLRIDGASICTPFFEVSISQNENNQIASWKMYIELITRVSTQHLPTAQGDESAALESIYKLFEVTREITKEYGREAETFSMLSICMLNLILRPFTTKWHKIFVGNSITDEVSTRFREELLDLQTYLSKFTALFLQMANVEKVEAINFETLNIFADVLRDEFISTKNMELAIKE